MNKKNVNYLFAPLETPFAPQNIIWIKVNFEFHIIFYLN